MSIYGPLISKILIKMTSNLLNSLCYLGNKSQKLGTKIAK